MVATATLILVPTDTITNDATAYSAVGTANLWDAADPGSPLNHDDDTTYVTRGSGGASNQKFGFGIDDTFTEKMATILTVKVHTRHRLDSGSDTVALNIVLSATTSAGSVPISASYTNRDSGALAKPGGGEWVEADIRDSSFEMQWDCLTAPAAAMRITSLWVEVEYIPLNRTIDIEREVSSRRLRLNREPEELVTQVTGWEGLEAELVDPVGFSHAHGPTPDGQGWGVKDWERGLGRLKKQVIDLSAPKITNTIGNRRRYQTTFWEIMKLSVSGDPDIADGLPRLDGAGASRQFSRASNAWVEDIGGVVKQISASKEKIESAGILVEEARTNLLTQSSFKNGTTGWTKTETTGTADFAADTTDIMFESTVAGAVTVTATAATHDIDISRATDSLAGSTVHTVSADIKQSQLAGSSGIGVFLQNDTTANWLDIFGAWGSRPALPPLGQNTILRNRITFAFTTESTASTHTLFHQCLGTTNSIVYHLYHSQVEVGAWASSRKLTEASAVAGALDSLLIDNASTLAQRVFPVDKFTAKIKFTPLWDSADPSGTVTILELYHDASNGIRIEHTTATALRFVYEHAGTTETASYSSPGLVAGTEYEIVIRKGSSSAELDEAARTMSIFLDGTKGGTTDTAASDLTEAAAGIMQIGALNDDTQIANGHFGEIMVSPIVFSDTEISGGLP